VSGADDFLGDMPTFPFDDRDADAVFGGSSVPDAVPEDLRDVADLVRAARRAGSADELVGEDVIVAQIVAAVGEHVSSLESGAHERIPVLSKLRTAKLAVASTAMLVLGATAAAAATGTFPSPAHSQAKLTVARAASATLPTAVPLDRAEHRSSRHHHRYMKHGLVGTVASINGASDPNTCGTAGGTGSFTVTRHDQTYIVNIDAATKFRDKDTDVTDPSFANVCVGGLVAVKGGIDDTTVDASKVTVIPPRARKGAFGVVASVNGVSDANTCGTADAAGSFTITGRNNQTFTVNVDPATEYHDKDVSDASFANVCVGTLVAAKGDVTGQIVTADKVFIVPVHQDDSGVPVEPPVHEMRGVFGTVASVNGVSDANTCGTADAAGSFTITSFKDGNQTFTVNVDPSTQFFAPGTSDASFADICVGGKVGVKGGVTDTTVAATSAFVLPKFDRDFHGRDHRGDCDKDHNGFDPSARTKAWDCDHDGEWKHDGRDNDVNTVAANGSNGYSHHDHSGGGWDHHGDH